MSRSISKWTVCMGLAWCLLWPARVVGQDCSEKTNCLDCIMTGLCGWCDGECKDGTANGPGAGACESWAWMPDDCPADCNHNGVPDDQEMDTDGDGVIDACDNCPDDPHKSVPGVCGCGVAQTDSDADGVPDCIDDCPNVPNTDTDGNGVPDCLETRDLGDLVPDQPAELEPGFSTARLEIPTDTPNLFILVNHDCPQPAENCRPSGSCNSYVHLVLMRGNDEIDRYSDLTDAEWHLRNLSAGAYTVHIRVLAAATLTVKTVLPQLVLGQWTLDSVGCQYTSAWYQFDVPQGMESLFVSADTIGLYSMLKIYRDTLGGTPYAVGEGHRIDLTLPAPTAGTWYVELMDSGFLLAVDQRRDWLIRVDTQPIAEPAPRSPLITELSPPTGGTGGPVTITISGAGLDPEATVQLSMEGQSPIAARRAIGSEDHRVLQATFDLADALPGAWVVTVTNPDGQRVSATQPFMVQSRGSSFLWAEVAGRSVVRVERWATFYVNFGNSGSIDAYDLVLFVRVPKFVTSSVECPTIPEALLTAGDIGPDDVPNSVEIDDDMVALVWVIGLPAGARQTIPVQVWVPAEHEGESFSIRADLHRATASRFSETGDPADIRTSPVFEALVQAAASTIDQLTNETGRMKTRAFSGSIPPLQSREPPTPEETQERLREGLGRLIGKDILGEVTPKIKGVAGGALIGAAVVLLLPAEVTALGVLGGAAAGAAIGYGLAELYHHLTGPAHLLENEGELLEDTSQPMFDVLDDALRQARLDSLAAGSVTPEDKFGPAGYVPPGTGGPGAAHFLRPAQPLEYRIDFWNKEDASAPAQRVFIEDELDADLDWSTLAFTEFGFLRWTVPLEDLPGFELSVDLRPDMNLVVNVAAHLDANTGKINWSFESTDPATGEAPEDPLAGFLPAITESGYEIGWVKFRIGQRADLPSGTEIANQAHVNFDGVGPWNPAPKTSPYVNTIDVGAPHSNVVPLDETQTSASFLVNWTGEDDAGGSGIRDYAVYDSVDDGPFELWLTTTATSATYDGEIGHRYAFYSRAVDNVGHLEPPKLGPEATTAVAADRVPPPPPCVLTSTALLAFTLIGLLRSRPTRRARCATKVE